MYSAFYSYGDMYPITAAGRILTCLCALFGSATMGMLVSVFVDRYQRVYNQKMYITEPDIQTVDFDSVSNVDNDEVRSVHSSLKLSRRRNLSAVLNQRLSSIQEKIKNDRRQSSEFQLIVSFNENNKDHNVTEHMIAMMKKKLMEAISTADMNVNLKLIDNDSQELWKISSSNSRRSSNLTSPRNMNDVVADHQSKIAVF